MLHEGWNIKVCRARAVNSGSCTADTARIILAVFRGSIPRILPDSAVIRGSLLQLWILPVLPSISRFCTAGTASTGSISSVGTARTRVLGVPKYFQ